MNFTSDVKKEIIARGISGGAAKKAALSAFVRTSGQLFLQEGKPVFSIVTETENVAEFFMDLFERAFQEQLSVARASMDQNERQGQAGAAMPRRTFGGNSRSAGTFKEGRRGIFLRDFEKTRRRQGMCARLYQRSIFGGRELYSARKGRRKDGISPRIRLSRKARGGRFSPDFSTTRNCSRKWWRETAAPSSI